MRTRILYAGLVAIAAAAILRPLLCAAVYVVTY